MSLDYKLRFLAGPTSGRELLIPAGDLRLGGDDPDIDIPLAQGGAAILHLSDEGVAIDPGPKVWVDGVLQETHGLVPFGKVIDIDGVALVFGRAADPLPMRSVPKRHEATTRRSPKAAVLAALAIVSILLLGVMVTVLTGGANAGTPASAPTGRLHVGAAADDSSISALIRELGLSSLAFQRDAAGSVVLSGNCADSASLHALKERLRQHGLRTREELMCDDQLRRQIEAVLSMNGYEGTEIRLGTPPGNVTLRGSFKGDAQWERTEQQLRRMAHIKSLTVTNDDAEHFQALLARLRQENQLQGLSIRVSGQRIVVSGQLPTARQATVQGVLHSFNRQSGSRLQAVFENIPLARPLASILPAPIESLSGDSGAPLLRLMNGMSLSEGAILPGGFTIFALSPEGVTVLRHLELLYLPLGLANS